MMYTYAATLIRCVDADTVRLELDLGFKLKRHEDAYRLLRINAPEMNTEEGKAAKGWLEVFLTGKSLVAQTQKSDSFGRWLAELWANGENCSDALVAAGKASYASYH